MLIIIVKSFIIDLWLDSKYFFTVYSICILREFIMSKIKVLINPYFEKCFSHCWPDTSQTHHMYSTLKRRGNDCFHFVSTWSTRGLLIGGLSKFFSREVLLWFRTWLETCCCNIYQHCFRFLKKAISPFVGSLVNRVRCAIWYYL